MTPGFLKPVKYSRPYVKTNAYLKAKIQAGSKPLANFLKERSLFLFKVLFSHEHVPHASIFRPFTLCLTWSRYVLPFEEIASERVSCSMYYTGRKQ